MILTLSLSLTIGLLLGLLGGGGSILTVPMLVYVLDTEPKTAIVTSFVVVGISSVMAILQHARKRHVCWKSGVFFGLAGMAGAFGGGRLAAYFSNEVLMALFGLVTLTTGIAMLRARRPASVAIPLHIAPALCPVRVPYLRVLFDGFFVGGLTGLVGVGGGFLIVPALTLLVRLPMPAAVGTSLLVIAMNAAAGLAGYSHHAALDLPLTGIVLAGAVTGSIFGGWLSVRLRAELLRRMFGGFVLSIGGYVLYQSLNLQLIATITDRLGRHIEFILGIAALALALTLIRVAGWIHRSGPDHPSPGASRRAAPIRGETRSLGGGQRHDPGAQRIVPSRQAVQTHIVPSHGMNSEQRP